MSGGNLIPRTLSDDAGIRHLALTPNGADAWWTPIACGEGIFLPGSQTLEPVDCPDCIVYMEARP